MSTQRRRLGRPALPVLLTGLVAGVLTGLLLTACSGGSQEATDPAPTASASVSPQPTEPALTPAGYPPFAAEDYTYRLEVLCFCPLTGPVEVTVADGEITSAVVLEGDGAGQEAPEFARQTINDIIDAANAPAVSSVQVTWPDGAEHPSSVTIDRIEMATDDEVTYTISDVRVG